MAVPGTKKRSKGSSTTDVVLAAVLSVLLGASLGAALLIFKAVPTVQQIPKDAPADAVYFIPGNTDASRGAEADSAQRAFVAGSAIAVDETILNCEAAALSAKPDAGAAKPDQPKPPAPNFGIEAGVPNVRIAGGVIHVASKVQATVFGQDFSVMVQTAGTFDKSGSSVVFNPDKIYVGTLQVQRMPILSKWVIARLLLPRSLPGALTDAWARLSTASIDGTTLRLSP